MPADVGERGGLHVGGVFVNYRRGDHIDMVHHIRDQLARHFGWQQVFLDTSSIELGHSYPQVLRKRLLDSDVVLAVIHERWLLEHDGNGTNRLELETDWVRKELEIALAAKKKVVPVLLGDAEPPASTDLPEPIRGLAQRQAHRVRCESRSADVAELVGKLEFDIAPTWTPRDVGNVESVARPGRWLGYVSAVLATVLFIGPSILVRNDAPVAAGAVPPLIPVAVESIVMMLAIPIIVLITHGLFGGVINNWERDLHKAPTTRYNLIIMPMVLVFVVIAMWINVQQEIAGPAKLAVFFVIFVSVARSVVSMIRRERDDKDLDVRWPHLLASSPRPSSLRRAVARLEDRLNGWASPLSREERDKGIWMLQTLRDGVRTMRRDADQGRLRWLSTSHPWLFSGYVLWAAGTTGLVLASAVPEIRGGTGSIDRWAIIGTAFASIVSASFLLTVHIAHRMRRRWRRAVATELAGDVAVLQQRFDVLVQIPYWQSINID
jgi:hypothetical protein